MDTSTNNNAFEAALSAYHNAETSDAEAAALAELKTIAARDEYPLSDEAYERAGIITRLEYARSLKRSIA